MTNREIHEALQSAKVYIDFGDHPGKDRLPREAAINGCCIITDKEGSAFYQEDVPIPEEYKLERNDTSINSILNRINDCLENYSERINDFSNYRNFILSEKDRFNDDVKRIFLD